MSKNELRKIDYMQDLEEIHHMLIDKYSEPIFFSNSEGRYLYVNRAFAEIAGRSADKIVGKLIWDVFVREEADKLFAALNQVFEQGEENTVEIRLPKKNTFDYYLAVITPRKNSYGKVQNAICFLKDISAYKGAEKALGESEEKLRALQSTLLQFCMVLSGMNTSILLTSNEDRVEFVNQAFCDICGSEDSPADLIGLTINEINQRIKDSCQDLYEEMELIQEMADKEQPVKNEEVCIRGRTCLRDYIPLHMNGKSYGRFWHYVDITERKQMEEALKEREQLLLVSQKVARIGSYMIDMKTGIWKCSPELNEIFGINETYPHTMESWFEVIHPDWRKEFYDYYSMVEMEKIPFDYEYKIIMINNGKECWVHGLGDLEFDSQGNPVRLIGTIQDITKRKRTEEEIIYLSYHDKLTGLYNRRFFEMDIRRLDVERNLPISIIIGDVNGLKLVNDAFGHDIGDELILKVASAIQNACRVNDLVARWGGDEFVVLLPKTKTEEVEKIVNRIRELYSSESVNSLSVSVSFGWDTKKKNFEDIEKVFKSAEDKMYENKIIEKEGMRGKAVSNIITSLHERNPREKQHSERMSKICLQIGKALNLSGTEIKRLGVACYLHDIGKIAIKENVLNKPGKLTAQEWHEIKRHSDIGYRILSSSYDMFDLADWVFAHHERWDGNGYPKGLKGNNIPLMARIITLVDAYDAMTSEQNYCEIKDEEEVIAEIRNNAGKQFDPEIARIFVEQVLKKSWT
jgi:diguanylate cyclase (GGDEF)-like protein/PAS domain S-box-containing protein